MRSPFEIGYLETLGALKLATDATSTWMPPNARPERPSMFQGSEAAAHARSVGADKAPPGLLRRGWSKFRGLPLKAQLGIGAGAAGLLGLGALMVKKHKDAPGSQYAYQDLAPELQAAAYQQHAYD